MFQPIIPAAIGNAIIIITGIFLQLFNDFYNIEIFLYIKEFFGYKLIGLILLCVLSMSIQIFFNQKFTGYAISAIIIIALPIAAGIMGWNNGLYQFNSGGPRLLYSDMNGYGHQLFSFVIYKSYWISFAMILIIFSNLMWIRGKEKGFKIRFRIAKT